MLNTSLKHAYLRTILQHANPDIIGLVKMNANPSHTSTDTIVNKVLNSYCYQCYSHATFTNNSGYNKTNMLYYKKSKLGLISTTTIYSSDPNISDINLYKLYYKSPDLSITHDTILINVILVHDDSGSGSQNQRATEIAGAMSWLNVNVKIAGNYIFMGDFNTQSSDQTCYQDMVNSSYANTKFYDPVNQPGAWSANPNKFADYLTQSTRLNDPGDCLATGGINNRFDMILCTQPIISGTDNVKYIPAPSILLVRMGNIPVKHSQIRQQIHWFHRKCWMHYII